MSNAGASDLEGLGSSLVSVTSDEVLEEELGISEITGIVLETLSVGAHEGFLEIGSVPDPSGHGLTSEEGLSLLDKLISSHLDVLVKEVATEDLLSVLVVDHVGGNEEHSKGDLGRVLQVLVVEVHVVIVKEDERSQRTEHQKLFVVRVVNVQVSHVIIPLGIVGVEEHSVKRELRANSLNNIE